MSIRCSVDDAVRNERSIKAIRVCVCVCVCVCVPLFEAFILPAPIFINHTPDMQLHQHLNFVTSIQQQGSF